MDTRGVCRRLAAAVLLMGSAVALAQTDPGPRPGPNGAGQPVPGLTPNEAAFFDVGRDDFAEAEGVGEARGDEFRTAPLWGLGKRVFFLHDGRTSNLLTAIQAHGSNGNGTYQSSEANAVVNAFNALTPTQKQNLVNFLRSL